MNYERRFSTDPQPATETLEAMAITPPSPLCTCEGARSFTVGDPERRPEITSPDAAAELLVPMLRGLDREHAMVISLDTKHRLLAVTLVSIGSVDHTFMSPREIFRDALANGASAIVLGHNHPSGDARASGDDIKVSNRIAQAGETIGIALLDHLIIGSHRWVSMAREGNL